MLSLKTLYEITDYIESLPSSEVDRIISIFNFKYASYKNRFDKEAKCIEIFKALKSENSKGPFGIESIQMELLKYLIDRFHKKHPKWENGDEMAYLNSPIITFKNVFGFENKRLFNSLKRDGFTIEGDSLRKALPLEIDEANTESELEKLLNKHNFKQTQSHLKQAIDNHSEGKWASANSQFRTFFESLLIEICLEVLPNNPVKNASGAWKLLSETASPPFLSEKLNEVSIKREPSFVPGLWSRLNPEGSHPGVSNEEDSTFRYHTSLVFAYYLMVKLTNYI